jgi:hypothetical protein
MVKFAEFSAEERRIVEAIVNRAIKSGIYAHATDAAMDISAAHASCPLRLADLRDADQFNFDHDMYGIRRHLNRKTGKLAGFFFPRFAA